MTEQTSHNAHTDRTDLAAEWESAIVEYMFSDVAIDRVHDAGNALAAAVAEHQARFDRLETLGIMGMYEKLIAAETDRDTPLAVRCQWCGKPQTVTLGGDDE